MCVCVVFAQDKFGSSRKDRDRNVKRERERTKIERKRIEEKEDL